MLEKSCFQQFICVEMKSRKKFVLILPLFHCKKNLNEEVYYHFLLFRNP